MNSRPRELLVFENDAGNSPFDNWLDALKDQRGRAKIQTRMDRLEEGHFGDYKPVGEGVLELRIDFGPGYRVYCAEHGSKIIVLLCGGDKSTQDRDIRQAKKHWRAYKA